MAKAGVAHMQKALMAPLPNEGAYLHWDDLRRRPPPDGLASDEWWAGLKMRRMSSQIQLPFRDKTGRPFWITEPPFIRSALRSVDLHWGGALKATGPATPTAGQGRNYLVRSLAEEPFSSSFLEGAATTREIAKALIFRNRQPKTRDERMVLNNYRAMIQVKTFKSLPLSVDSILLIHRTVIRLYRAQKQRGR
jgi:hypothetical protein